MSSTREQIDTNRERLNQSRTEINRWGMVLASATECRAALRRGINDANPQTIVENIRRVLMGTGAVDAETRRSQLEYLSTAQVSGPNGTSTFFDRGAAMSPDIKGFSEAFQGYIADGDPTAAAVTDRFENEVITPAVETYETDPTMMDDLVALVEHGLRAAKVHRDRAIEHLNNGFDEANNHTDVGAIQQFYDEASDSSDARADYEIQWLGCYSYPRHPL